MIPAPPAESDPAGPNDIRDVRPASLWRRWSAMIYEALLLTALVLVAGFAVLPLLGSVPAGSRGVSALQVLPPASRAFLFVYYVAVLGAYCVFFWTRGRRTLAMKTWRLTIRTRDGLPLDARSAVKRYMAAWIGPAIGLAAYAWLGRWGLVAGLANYAWAWIDRDSQFLHDRIAGTQIVVRS